VKYLLSILVENRPGVLARIADMFSARGYNIDSLSVAETLDPTVSRVTCTTTGSEEIVEQIVKQLRKLIDVLRVVHFPLGSRGFVTREMLLVKVEAREHQRSEIMRIAEIFRSKVVDVGKEHLTLEVTGDEEKIQAILELLNSAVILEVARTGLVALPRNSVAPRAWAKADGRA
jgi:acetolactate synthase-1/3 small subunit